MEQRHLSPNPTEVDLFEHYFAKRKANGGAGSSFDELADDFREYKRQFDDLKAKLREAEEQSARGESGPLDIDKLLDELRAEWVSQGIPR